MTLAGANDEILFVTDSDMGATHVFFFNSGTGELTEATGSPEWTTFERTLSALLDDVYWRSVLEWRSGFSGTWPAFA
jgi:hypothetical protein